MLKDSDRPLVFGALILTGAFMVHAFLSFAATGEFKPSFRGIGPTEIRLAFVGINVLACFMGVIFIRYGLATLTVLSLIILPVIVYGTQRRLRQIDLNVHDPER